MDEDVQMVRISVLTKRTMRMLRRSHSWRKPLIIVQLTKVEVAVGSGIAYDRQEDRAQCRDGGPASALFQISQPLRRTRHAVAHPNGNRSSSVQDMRGCAQRYAVIKGDVLQSDFRFHVYPAQRATAEVPAAVW